MEESDGSAEDYGSQLIKLNCLKQGAGFSSIWNWYQPIREENREMRNQSEVKGTLVSFEKRIVHI